MELTGMLGCLESGRLVNGLLGHSGEVFSTRFDSTGQHIASGSMDRSISQYKHFPPPRGTSTLLITSSALAHLQTV